jgi:hypothetical protein
LFGSLNGPHFFAAGVIIDVELEAMALVKTSAVVPRIDPQFLQEGWNKGVRWIKNGSGLILTDFDHFINLDRGLDSLIVIR